jgi:hypothetical protein
LKDRKLRYIKIDNKFNNLCILSRHPAMILARSCDLKMRQSWQGSYEHEFSIETQIRIIENIYIYSQVLRRRLEPSLDKNAPSSIFMKNTPVASFKHVYTGSFRKEILHSWTCPPVITRLLANATNDNIRVNWEVSSSSKLLEDIFLMLTKPALALADHASS